MIKEITAAVARRVGSLVAGYLVAQGMDAELIGQVVTGISAVATVSVDLILSHINEKKNENANRNLPT